MTPTEKQKEKLMQIIDRLEEVQLAQGLLEIQPIELHPLCYRKGEAIDANSLPKNPYEV